MMRFSILAGLFYAATMFLAGAGCGQSSDELPSVPPPPPPGTIKEASGAPASLPPSVMEKLQRKKTDDTAKEEAKEEAKDAAKPEAK